jgi:hypothetical protein
MDNPYFAAGVIAAERCARDGMPITADSLNAQDSTLPLYEAEKLVNDDRFAAALEEVGVNFSPLDRVSMEQLAAVKLYLMDQSRTHAAKLRAAGISQTKWSGWMRQPRFREYINTFAMDTLHDALPGAHLALAREAQDGKQWATTLLYQVTGFFDPNRVEDPRRFFEGIFEVLSDEGVDERILAKVAGRIRELADPNGAPAPRPAMILAEASRMEAS